MRKIIITMMLFLAAQDAYSKSACDSISWSNGSQLVASHFLTVPNIQEWVSNKCKNASAERKDFELSSKKCIVFICDVCSGLYCPYVYVFIQDEAGWKLLCYTHLVLKDSVIVEQSVNSGELIFKVNGNIIGNLKLHE